MASKRALRRSSCTGKKRHVTFVKAEQAMHKLLRHEGGDGRLEVYRCRFCCGYHFGHTTSSYLPRRRLLALLEAL